MEEWLNYKHLYYFWIIAKSGSIVKAGTRLKLAQSTLSAQLKLLEETLGHELFDRQQRSLQMTEAGRLVFEYAEDIFATGRELMDVLKNRPVPERKTVVRIGCINSISKRLQYEFASPCLKDPNIQLHMVEGTLPELARQLQNHTLDVVISNTPARAEREEGVFNHPIGQIDVWMVGRPQYASLKKNLPRSLNGAPTFLPTRDSQVRSDIDLYFQQNGVRPEIRGEIEDIALLRVFGMGGEGIIIVPEIAVTDELRSGELVLIDRLPSIFETVWAITASRKMPNPRVAQMVKIFSGRYQLKS